MPSPNPSPVRDATANHRGLLNITDQIISGVKSFMDYFKLANRTTAALPVLTSGDKGAMLYNTTTNRAMIYDGTQWVQVVMAVASGSIASLEEHLISSGAHTDENIEYIGGSLAWADGSEYNPDANVDAAIQEIVNNLSSDGGAAKVGAQPQLKSTSEWTDISSSVNTTDGWATLGGPIEAIVVGDRVLLKGVVRRALGDNTKSKMLDLPVDFRVTRYQPKPVACISHSPFAYQLLAVGGGYTALPGLYVLGEPAPGLVDLDITLDGLELCRF